MKRLILHLGVHKTGSTALQQFLFDNRKRLLEEGILYPESGVDYFAHQNLAYELLGDARFQPENGTVADLLNEIRDSHVETVVVSSENFEFLGIADIEALRDRFHAEDISIEAVVYLRNQLYFLESEYTQRVKHGFYLGDINQFVEEEIGKDRYHYQRYLAKWKSSLAKFSISFFGKQHLIGGDIVADFCRRTLNLDQGTLATFRIAESKANTKPPLVLVESLRLLAGHYVGSCGTDPYLFSQRIAQPLLKSARPPSFESEIVYFSDTLAETLASEFRLSNQTFMSEFADCFQDNKVEVFPPYSRATNAKQQLTVSAKDFLHVLTQVKGLLCDCDMKELVARR